VIEKTNLVRSSQDKKCAGLAKRRRGQ